MKKFMSSHVIAGCTCLLFSLTACNSGTSTEAKEDSMAPTDNKMSQHAVVTLTGTEPDTTVTGTVTFDQDGDKVKMNLQISVPKEANKVVAVHIHETGACGDMGKAAGGHWNPSNQSHGKWGSASFHAGDIGNVNLDANGNGTMEMETDLWSIGGDASKNILNHSIIVHSGADDYTTQPSGNSGSRIGCGVIQQANQ